MHSNKNEIVHNIIKSNNYNSINNSDNIINQNNYKNINDNNQINNIVNANINNNISKKNNDEKIFKIIEENNCNSLLNINNDEQDDKIYNNANKKSINNGKMRNLEEENAYLHSSINVLMSKINDMQNEQAKMCKKFEEMSRNQKEGNRFIAEISKKQEEDKKLIELRRLSNNEIKFPQFNEIWNNALRFPWEEKEPDPIVWTILNREIFDYKNRTSVPYMIHKYCIWFFNHEDIIGGYHGSYMRYLEDFKEPVEESVIEYKNQFDNFNNDLKLILENIPNSQTYTNLRQKISNLIKNNNDGMQLANEYESLYKETLFDKEVKNLQNAAIKFLNRIDEIKNNISLKKFQDISEKLKNCCDKNQKDWQNIKDNDLKNL